MCSYIGITAHYIYDWKLEQTMLACKRFNGHHTADNIVTQYEDKIINFGICSKFGHIITDSASNMVKAFSLPGYDELAAVCAIGRAHSSESSFNFEDEDKWLSNYLDENTEETFALLLNTMSALHIHFNLWSKMGWRKLVI